MSEESARPDSKDVLLRAAYDILRRAEQSCYVKSALETVAFYDGVNCDGYCLMQDIADELNLDTGEDPIPLGKEEA